MSIIPDSAASGADEQEEDFKIYVNMDVTRWISFYSAKICGRLCDDIQFLFIC